MRKFKYILLAAVSFFGLLMGGCIKDSSDLNYEGDAQIELELSTFAVNGGSDTNAKESEKVIKSAYVFIFNAAGVLENPGKTAVTTLNSNGEVIDATKRLNAKWTVFAGNKDIYVVTNPDTDLADQLVAMSAKNGLQKSALEKLLTGGSLFSLDVASFAEKGMLMTGKVTASAVSGVVTTVPVTVKRRHARIDFMLRKAKDLEGATVVVKSVKYKNQIIETQVFPSTPPIFEGVDFIVPQTANNKTIEAQQATAGEWSGKATDYTEVTEFYSYERSAENTDGTSKKAACLEMTVSINGSDKLLPVYICSTAIGTNKTGNDEDEPVAIEANKVYKVLGTLTRQSVDLALDILDWNDKNVNGDIYGADFSVSKSYVMIPVVNNTGSSEKIDLSATENIKFLYSEYNGTTSTTGANIPVGLTLTGLEAFDGSADNGSITLTSDNGSVAKAPLYLWFKAGNIKKRIEINYIKYFFVITEKPTDYTYLGGTQPYTIQSYKILTKDAGLGWTAEFSEDGGATWTSTRPSWVSTFINTLADGGTNTTSHNAEVDARIGAYVHNDNLKKASSVSNYDLSQGGETANCYIVNAPGTYSIPLIYGNARKANGTVNTDAFTAAEGLYILSSFLSATGTIPANGKITGAKKAELIWQDAQDLVRVDATLGGTTADPTLTFTVPAENICQGNAVVAVRDASNRVLWSWHIWVTDYNPAVDHPKSFVNATGYTYKFMPVNLGWCDGLTYPARSVKVRFTQNESGIQKEMDLNQLFRQEPGNSPYYQWGRKDPFVGALQNNVNKTWYSAKYPSGTATAPPSTTAWEADKSEDVAKNIITNGILNPGTYCANTNMDYYYYNLWSATCTFATITSNDLPVIKTIYDPSPVGYHMPAGNAFTGFTTTGGNTSTASEFNKTGTFDKGWTFSKAGSDDVFFPAAGYRNYISNSAVGSVGSNGHYWAAVSGDGNHGCILYLNSGSVRPLDNDPRAYGYLVRPVAD